MNNLPLWFKVFVWVIVLILMCAVSKTFAFRCGTHLINEGDDVSRMVDLCGEPEYSRGQTKTYINKDGNGMDYTVHVDSNGVIDDVEFNRGGQ